MNKLVATITTLLISSFNPVHALTDDQAKAGGIVAGGMCMEYQGIHDEATISQLIRTTMAQEGMEVVKMVSQPEVKGFERTMLNLIKDQPNCGMDL